MFVRLTHQVLKGISYSQSIVTRRLLCSSDKDLYLKNTKYADKKLQYEIEAEEVMSNLSEEGRQKKKRLEVQLEIMRQRNEKVPSKLSQTDWMILVNECNGDGKERSFIEYLYEKEETRLKRKIFKKEVKKSVKSKGELVEIWDSKSLYKINRMKSISRWKGVKAMMSDIDVIVDFGFDFNLQAQRCMYNHLELLLLANRYHLQPLHVHLTSIEKNYRTKSALEDDDRVYASFHKSHFLDLFPRKDLVYLTADGPPMKEFDTKCTYIIGGIGDFGTEKYTTLKFAKKHGLRYASFPISDYFSAPNIDLRAYCVHSILLEMYLHGSWKEAFIKHLPHMFTLLKDVATDSDIKLRENCLTKEHSDKEWFRNSEKIVNILKGKRAII